MCKYTAYILNGWTHSTKFDVRNLIRRIVSHFVQYYNSDSIKFHTVLNFVPYYNSDTHRCPKFNPVRNLVWAKYNLVRNLIWTKNIPVRNLIHLRYFNWGDCVCAWGGGGVRGGGGYPWFYIVKYRNILPCSWRPWGGGTHT